MLSVGPGASRFSPSENIRVILLASPPYRIAAILLWRGFIRAIQVSNFEQTATANERRADAGGFSHPVRYHVCV